MRDDHIDALMDHGGVLNLELYQHYDGIRAGQWVAEGEWLPHSPEGVVVGRGSTPSAALKNFYAETLKRRNP